MDFQLSEQSRAIKNLVRQLTERYAFPLEAKVLRGEEILDAERQEMLDAVAAQGLFGPAIPEEHGGCALNTVDNVVCLEEANRSLVPLNFGGSAPFITGASEAQLGKYFRPAIRGEKRFFFAQTEDGGGSDPASMRTTAIRDGDNWVINGSKMFISGAAVADYGIVMAVTDKDKRQHGGITAFLVDADNPGLQVVRRIPVMGFSKEEATGGDTSPCELVFDDCVVPAESVLGEVGGGFRVAQQELSTQRMNIGAQCVGIASRCYEMMTAYAKQRVVFGDTLASKQAIQSMIVDSWIDLHTTRLVTYEAAWKNDLGDDTRIEAGMVKLLGTEMVTRAVDRAIQVHGGYGVTTELPFAHWYNRIRLMRIYEGPTEVQKYRVVARALLS